MKNHGGINSMRNAKIIVARYKKGIMSKLQVIAYLQVCGMDNETKEYIISNL